AASAVADAVSLSEIAPTILRAAGVAAPVDMKGRDLVRLVRTRGGTHSVADDGSTASTAAEGRAQPDLYAETEYPRAAGWTPLQALTDGRWKTIAAGGGTEIYDLAQDPREERDLSASQTSTAAAMRGRIDSIHASGGAVRSAISDDARERL